jgi:hypothetical protein
MSQGNLTLGVPVPGPIAVADSVAAGHAAPPAPVVPVVPAFPLSPPIPVGLLDVTVQPTPQVKAIAASAIWFRMLLVLIYEYPPLLIWRSAQLNVRTPNALDPSDDPK